MRIGKCRFCGREIKNQSRLTLNSLDGNGNLLSPKKICQTCYNEKGVNYNESTC